MANEHQESLRCPKCDSYGPFDADITMRGVAMNIGDGATYELCAGWSDGYEVPRLGFCTCCDCGHESRTSDFMDAFKVANPDKEQL